jgi:RHS repeat-associated protein
VIDAEGNSTVTANDGKTSYLYDEMDRLTSIDYSDLTPDVGFGYDANSNRDTMTDAFGSVSYSYDALDRLESVSRGGKSFTYEYDDVGNVTKRTYPDNTVVDYAYTVDGQLDTVTSGEAVTDYDYDAAGLLKHTILPTGNGYVENRAYDRAGRLTEIKNEKATSVLSKVVYTLDEVGNPTSMETMSGLTSYGYDSLDRLTEVCFAVDCPDEDDPFIRYAYDEVGNREQEIRPDGTTNYTYDAADQLEASVAPSGTTDYDFDLDGNMTGAGDTSFNYDLAGRMTSASGTSTAATYSYDGDGKRVQATQGEADEACDYRGEVMSDDPAGYWRLDERSGTVAEDETEFNDGEYKMSPALDRPGLPQSSARAVSFDGQDDYVDVPNSSSLRPGTGSWSVEFWIKRSGAGTGDYPPVIGTRAYNNAMDNGWAIHLNGSNFKVAAHLADGSSGFDVASAQSDSSVTQGEKQHWVIVFDRSAGTVKFYKNGVLDATRTPSFPTGSVNQTNRIYIARDIEGSNNRRLSATLDEVAVYPSVLSAARIGAHYTADCPAHDPSDITNYAWDINAPLPQLAAENDGTNHPLRRYTHGNDLISMTTGGQETVIQGPRCDYPAEVASDSPAGHWRLGEATGTTANDESSNGSDGTYVGTHTKGQPGVVDDDSVDFQGGYVDVGNPSSLRLSTPWTIEGWIRPSETNGSGSIVSEAYEGDGNVRFVLGYDEASSSHMFIGFCCGGGWTRAVDPQAYGVGEWIHYAGTYDGSTLKLYRNGELVASTNTTSATPSGNERILIGRRWDTGATLKGRIDEVAIYPSALSATSVKAHYDCGVDTGLVTATTGGETYYYHYGATGSVTDVTDESGDPQWSYSYEPFGTMMDKTKVDSSAPENFMRFTGEYFDNETDRYHLRARQYDPGLGRFTATDPFAPAMVDPYVAAYAYVNNRPTVFTDPSGETPLAGEHEQSGHSDDLQVYCEFSHDRLCENQNLKELGKVACALRNALCGDGYLARGIRMFSWVDWGELPAVASGFKGALAFANYWWKQVGKAPMKLGTKIASKVSAWISGVATVISIGCKLLPDA